MGTGQLHQGLGRLELPTLWDFRNQRKAKNGKLDTQGRLTSSPRPHRETSWNEDDDIIIPGQGGLGGDLLCLASKALLSCQEHCVSTCYSSGIWLYTSMSLCGLHGPHETEKVILSL